MSRVSQETYQAWRARRGTWMWCVYVAIGGSTLESEAVSTMGSGCCLPSFTRAGLRSAAEG